MLAGSISALAQTAKTKVVPNVVITNKVNYTLKLWKNEKLICNPTEADIKAAVTARDNSEEGPRLVFSTPGNTNELQVSGTPKAGFSFDYHEGLGDSYPSYGSKKHDHSAETTIKLLAAYMKGADDWKKLVEGKKQQESAPAKSLRGIGHLKRTIGYNRMRDFDNLRT
jgi:hypothetical protein